MATITLRNPGAPATNKQLWLLHLLTKQDTRDWKLTMQEASDKINELKGNGHKEYGGKCPKGQGRWSIKTFKVVETTSYSEGHSSKHGYCTNCYADMTMYGAGKLIHYNSHQIAKRLGLSGK